jgi:hypothetical protein
MSEVTEVRRRAGHKGVEQGQADEVSCRPPNSEALNMTMSMESVIKIIILSLAICRLTISKLGIILSMLK